MIKVNNLYFNKLLEPAEEPLDYHLFKFFPQQDSSNFLSMSADYFGDLHLFKNKINLSKDNFSSESNVLYTFENHIRISSLYLNPQNQNQFVMGDIEGNLKFIQISEIRKKTNNTVLQLDTLVGSDNITSFKSVNDLIWTSNSKILCLGNDNSISTLEPSSLQASFRINTEYSTPLKAEVIKENPNCVMIGFEDGYLRLFDLRNNTKKAERLFKSHAQTVSCLNFNKYDQNLLVSGALDGLTKIWDMRSDRPLYSVKIADNSKIFSVKWSGSRQFLSGGDDSSLTHHVM